MKNREKDETTTGHNHPVKTALINSLSPGNAHTKYKIWVIISLLILSCCALLPSIFLRSDNLLHKIYFFSILGIAAVGLVLVRTSWQKWIAYILAVFGLSLTLQLLAFDLTNTGILIYLLAWSMSVSLGYGRELFNLKWFFGFMTAVLILFAISLLFTAEIEYALWERALLVASGTFIIGINIYLWSLEAKMSSNHYSERRQKYEDIASLSEKMTAILVSQKSLEDTFFDMAKKSQPDLNLDYCMIFLKQDDTLCSVDGKETLTPGGESIVCKAFQTRENQHITDTTLSNYPSLQSFPEAKSEIAIPIFNEGIIAGVIYGGSTQKDVLRDRQVEAMCVIASFCGLKLTQQDAENSIREAERTKAEVAQYKEINELKNRFITNISHDLKTPLSLIKAPATQIVKTAGEERIRNHANYILKNTEHLLRVVNQLLQLNRIEQGMNELYLEQVGLEKLIGKVELQYRGLAEKDGINFTTHTVDETILTDSFRLEQIIHNLVHNAFRYTGPRGNIALTLSKEENNLVICVSDNGPGIPEDQLEAIFERFTKLDVNNHEGTGIGLSLVKEYTQSLGGEVKVTSTAGEGTRFTVSIPYRKVAETPAVSEENELVDLTFTGKPELLIVEDHADLNSFIALSLEEEYHCTSAFDGVEALHQIAHKLPDIIITDLMMPKMDGNDLIRKVRENDNWSHIPIIVLSAKGQIESKVELYELGADNYLVKPFDILELEAIVKATLEQRKRLKAAFQSSYLVSAGLPEQTSASLQEKHSVMVSKLIDYVNTHLDDTDLNVSTIGQELGVGRNRLQKEVKDATGLTPVELIRCIRLNRAKTLLREPGKQISEVAYQVGFNNLSYFSRSFKNEFDCLPSEWQEQQV